MYDGEFYKGQYSGNGKLYQPSNGGLIYEGGFLNGEYYGTGKLWDDMGNLLYEGDFIRGQYFGHGTRYDPYSGMVLETGQFKYGVLTQPDPVTNVSGVNTGNTQTNQAGTGN